jgi:hypothetical protein
MASYLPHLLEDNKTELQLLLTHCYVPTSYLSSVGWMNRQKGVTRSWTL